MNPATKPRSLSHETYRTADLWLASFLQVQGHQILQVQTEGDRGVFVFAEHEDLRKDILRWGNDELVLIKARRFVHGMRDLKGLVSM